MFDHLRYLQSQINAVYAPEIEKLIAQRRLAAKKKAKNG